MTAQTDANFANEIKKGYIMRNNTTTFAAQSFNISTVLLSAKYEIIKKETTGRVFSSDNFAQNWKSIFVQPFVLSKGMVKRGMRKLTSPTLVITTKKNMMAYVLASETEPVYINSGLINDKDFGYLLAFRLAPMLLPEYMYYMCIYDLWKRVVNQVVAKQNWDENFEGWNSIGQWIEYEFSEVGFITAEDVLRNSGTIELPDLDSQVYQIAIAKKQSDELQKLYVTDEELNNLVFRYLSVSGGILGTCNYRIGLLCKLYSLAAGDKANPEVINVLSDEKYKYNDSVFSTNELDLLVHNIERVFPLLVNPSEFSWDKYPSYLQPQEITDFLVEIGDIPNGITVYNPFAGLASYGLKLIDNNVVGEEINNTTWAIAQIRIFVKGVNTQVVLKDSFDSLNSDEKFGGIITSPVYLSEKGREIHDIVNSLYDKLLDNGKMVCLVPISFLSDNRPNVKAVRKRLVNEHAIQSIITLPSNIFSGTSMIQCALVISKNIDNKVILFADASGYTRYEKSVYRMTTFDWEQFLKDLKDEIDDYYERGCEIDETTVGAPISYEEVLKNDWGLVPAYYLAPTIPNGIQLSELVEVMPSLSDDSQLADCFITPSDIPEAMHRKPFNPIAGNSENKVATAKTRIKISSDTVIIALSSGKIRTVYMEGLDVIAAYPYDLIKFLRPKKGYNAKYIAALLSLNSVKEQFIAQLSGTTMRRFTKLDISQIKVPKHETEEECERLISEVISSEMSNLENELEEILTKRKREIRSTRHAMIQTLSALSSNWEQLNYFAELNGGRFEFSNIVGKINPISVKELMQTIGYAISTLERQVEALRFERVDWGRDVAINPYEFINTYINLHNMPNVKMINVGNDNQTNYPWYNDETGDSGFEHTEAATVFYAPRRLVERIFNNIVANAISHGFVNNDNYNREIRFDWGTDGGNVFITVANNGCPLKEGVRGEDVLMNGFSTALNENGLDGTLHSGQGGYEIKLLMEGLGNVEVISRPNTDFPVIYKLTFEKTNFEVIDF